MKMVDIFAVLLFSDIRREDIWRIHRSFSVRCSVRSKAWIFSGPHPCCRYFRVSLTKERQAIRGSQEFHEVFFTAVYIIHSCMYPRT